MLLYLPGLPFVLWFLRGVCGWLPAWLLLAHGLEALHLYVLEKRLSIKNGKKNAAVSFSVFVVSEVWYSDRPLHLCNRDDCKKLVATPRSLCGRSLSLFLSFFLDLRHYETWTTPAENKDSAFSFISPPHPRTSTTIRLSVRPRRRLMKLSETSWLISN